jgi:hypothetical protein
MTAHAANDSRVHEQQGLDLALPVAKIRGEPMTEMPSEWLYSKTGKTSRLLSRGCFLKTWLPS